MEDSDDSGNRGDQPVFAGVFAESRQIGRDLGAVDWASTSLGAPEGWPRSLRTALSILLSSRFSMWMAWGPDLIFFCNDAYRLNTLGRKYPWALGRPAAEVWAEVWKDAGPRLESVLATGRATWDEALLLFLERSGYPEETYHTFSYSPLRDDSGAVAGMLCVVNEDTERVIGDRRMATLRDLGSDPSVARDEREVLAFARAQLERNPQDLPFTLTYLFENGHARLAGTTGVEPGRAAAVISPEDETPAWPAEAARRGEVTVVDLTGTTDLPSGAWDLPPTTALVVPLQRSGGAPHGFLVAGLNRYRPLDDGYRGFVELVAGHLAAGVAGARDFQAQQRRAEELAELDRAKTAFFSNISHEFRTPLTLIMGPVQDLRDRLAETDPQVGAELEVIHRNGLRLGKLVNTLLDFSRLEAGRMRASFQPVELAQVTAELAGVFRSAVERAGLAFEIDCPALPEPVYVDVSLWEKVVLNLLSNALKFTVDGSIGISVRAGAGTAVVTVADTGVGVPRHEIPRLFERFHRIEHSWSRSKEGSGIGLALVQELVALHGGTIRADSTEGEGTSFTVELPLGTDHLPADSLSPQHTPLPVVSDIAAPYVQEALRWLPDPDLALEDLLPATAAGAAPEVPATVLVADDNADMRDYLTRLLLRAGYEVRVVQDGVAALAAIRAQPPDLVISDVMMPRMDGLSLVTALRADPRTLAVPVLLLSARAGHEASGEGLRAGADDYLVKPFAAADLLARVRANVDLARLRGRHARWRDALIDSLQEAFFVCDDDGTVVEVNAAFTDIIGYGSEGLPYPVPHPWWPDEQTDPEARRQFAEAFEARKGRDPHGWTVPITHRDGRRLWVSALMNPARDPDSGRTVTVGTFRDVTGEHLARRREAALAEMSVRLSGATSTTDALTEALEQLEELWRADQVLAVVFGGNDAPQVRSAVAELAWDDLPEHQRETLDALQRHRALIPVLTGEGGVAVTVDHPDGPMVLLLRLGGHHPFTEQDELLLSLLAGHLTQGLSRARQIDQQRETALALQRAILGPSRLPDGFAVRYEPAARPLEVGGDWYDTFPLPGDRIGIVVGDCVGRGLSAAAVMGQLRSACRALLLQEIGPARALMALDQFAAGVPGALCTTVFCGVLDPGTGQLVYSSAGHPPAILALPDGSTHLLEGGRSLPLAVKPGVRRAEAECLLPPLSTLLTYTDGLVERRRSPLNEGIDRAAVAVQEGHASELEDLAGQIMNALSPDSGYDDDVALLLYRHPAPLDISFPAEPGQLSSARTRLRTWLGQCGFSLALTQRVLVAVGEASANAVEHAYRNVARQAVRLRLETAGRTGLRVTVTDTGTWKTPTVDQAAGRGRGTKIMRTMMDEVTIVADPTGTTVTMQVMISDDDATDPDQDHRRSGQTGRQGVG